MGLSSSMRIAGLLLIAARVVLAWDHVSAAELGRVMEVGEPVLVAFVQPAEPASAALEQEWLSAAAAAAAEATQHLLSVDCSAPEADCAILKTMPPYPFIFLLETDQPPVQYLGPRRAAAMLHFLSRRTRPAVSHGLSGASLAAFTAADETVFVAYGLDPAADRRELAAMWEDVAWRYRDEFSFGTAAGDAEVVGAGAEAQGLEVPVVVCYRAVDGDVVVMKGVDGVAELDKWVQEASRAVVGELTVLNRQRLLDRGWPMVYLFGATASERQDLRNVLYKFARSYYDSLTAVVVDPFEFPGLMGQMGLEPGVFPAGAVHQLSKNRIYPYPKGRPFSSESVQQWGLDVYQGRIKPWTPPGVTTTYDDLGPTRAATRKVSIRKVPGVKIKIAGHDEL